MQCKQTMPSVRSTITAGNKKDARKEAHNAEANRIGGQNYVYTCILKLVLTGYTCNWFFILIYNKIQVSHSSLQFKKARARRLLEPPRQITTKASVCFARTDRPHRVTAWLSWRKRYLAAYYLRSRFSHQIILCFFLPLAA